MENNEKVGLFLDYKNAKLQKALLNLGSADKSILEDIDLSSIINPENKIYFKTEEIAGFLGKGWTSTKVNETLRDMKYQFYFKKDYLPTLKGIESGCAHRLIKINYTENSTAFMFSLLWTIDIVDKIKEYLNEKREEQENGTK